MFSRELRRYRLSGGGLWPAVEPIRAMDRGADLCMAEMNRDTTASRIPSLPNCHKNAL